MFATYDRSHAGALGMDELRQCLADLGTLVRDRRSHTVSYGDTEGGALGSAPCMCSPKHAATCDNADITGRPAVQAHVLASLRKITAPLHALTNMMLLSAWLRVAERWARPDSLLRTLVVHGSQPRM